MQRSCHGVAAEGWRRRRETRVRKPHRESKCPVVRSSRRARRVSLSAPFFRQHGKSENHGSFRERESPPDERTPPHPTCGLATSFGARRQRRHSVDSQSHCRSCGGPCEHARHHRCRCCGVGCWRNVDGGGEYVSVSSQADTEQADLRRERVELATDRAAEEEELAQIYVARGLEPTLARQVSMQLMQYDALGSHARDELGISATTTARPLQAAFASAASFAVGAALPLVLVFVLPSRLLLGGVFVTTVVFLALLGSVAAHVGGARLWRGAARVAFWGAAAMAVTAAIGTLFGTPL